MTKGMNCLPTCHVIVDGGCRHHLDISLSLSLYPSWQERELHERPA